MACLAITEAITLEASVTLLGGSGEQSQRVLEYFSKSQTMPDQFWNHKNAPRYLLKVNNTRKTELLNTGVIHALMASQKSVRGPHPQRLRGDEIDEMDEKLWDAAQGQPMAARGIPAQVVGSSTHQNANGTMTRELDMAAENDWPVYEWCYKENHEDNGGWLTQAMVQEKKGTVPIFMWNTEYELQEPEVEGRAIATERVDEMFSIQQNPEDNWVGLGRVRELKGQLGCKYEFEQPVVKLDENGDPVLKNGWPVLLAKYATGVDWGKRRDKTIIITYRYDVSPARLVAFQHIARMPYPIMIGRYNAQAKKYKGYACHDATGLGTVVEDYLEVETESFTMTGLARTNLFSAYIVAIEDQEVLAPKIVYMYREHKTVTTEDLYRSGPTRHPPDSVVAGAMAWRAATGGGALFY